MKGLSAYEEVWMKHIWTTRWRQLRSCWEWDIAKGRQVLVQSGRELAIGIFGSAPDSATYFNRQPFISASRCPPPDQVSAFNCKTLGGLAPLPYVAQTESMQDYFSECEHFKINHVFIQNTQIHKLKLVNLDFFDCTFPPQQARSSGWLCK